MDIASEDDLSVPPSTKSRTCAAKDHRASSSASASLHVASSTISILVASFRRSASQARPGSGPSSRSQILTSVRSSYERWSSTFWNLVTSSPTTTARVVLLRECLSTDSMVEDSAT
jgi:hypothetical protein